MGWLLIIGIWLCAGGLVACVLHLVWNDMQPVDELAERRERRDVRVIRAPFDYEREEPA